ncbi:motile sperm domain-containing protein 2-like [Sorex araneus]|uniref:motile sperm domain-containing protein 2-like n=1 Tax=Sorex araneus TaxID=42254 RepID=UPI002433F3FC|nr:motile sperm domain-containing protein 2-like [Sorex araneus]
MNSEMSRYILLFSDYTQIPSNDKECFWCPTKRLKLLHESDQEETEEMAVKKDKKLQISDLNLDQNALPQGRCLPTIQQELPSHPRERTKFKFTTLKNVYRFVLQVKTHFGKLLFKPESLVRVEAAVKAQTLENAPAAACFTASGPAAMARSNAPSTALIAETRQRFEAEFVRERPEQYDPRDVARLRRDDGWVARYLAWRHNAVDEALRTLDASLRWRREMAVRDLDESCVPRALLEAGGVYLHGRDREGHRLLWIRGRCHARDPRAGPGQKRLLALWLERHWRRAGGRLTVLLDLSAAGLPCLDLGFARFLASCFRVYYPDCVARVVVFDLPWLLHAAFRVLRACLGAEALGRLTLAGRRELRAYVGAEYLPPHMGGTDAFRYCYPPGGDSDSSSEGAWESVSSGVPGAGGAWEGASSPEALPRSPPSVFRGPLLHVSPGDALCFGGPGENSLITLTNVTQNPVAFRVRPTAPEKFRVRPGSSSCEPGATVAVAVSPRGALTTSVHDRFLVTAAEMDQPGGTGLPQLGRFWKEVPRSKVMEHRLHCHVTGTTGPSVPREHPGTANPPPAEDVALQLRLVLESHQRLQGQVQRCLWLQQLGLSVTVLSLTFIISFFYLLYS